jgi:ABC-type phosphate/phosphonate transport system permease subunit
LQFLEGHNGDEHNTHQNITTIITNMMMIFILMIFTYSRSDNKIKFIMSENNTNNLNENLIEQDINLSFTT